MRVDAKTLVKQFTSDPGLAFCEIIRTAPQAVRATDIKREITDAGGKKADVDRLWKRLQPVIKMHPRIRLEDNRYGWAPQEHPAQASLNVLAGHLLAKLPRWLADALVENVGRGLTADSGDGAWAGKEYEKARLVADLAVAVDVLRARGAGLDEVSALFADEARRKRLFPVGRAGETVTFDPAVHEADTGAPGAGDAVRIVRPGYVWRGGGEPVVAVKAAVTV